MRLKLSVVRSGGSFNHVDSEDPYQSGLSGLRHRCHQCRFLIIHFVSKPAFCVYIHIIKAHPKVWSIVCHSLSR